MANRVGKHLWRTSSKNNNDGPSSSSSGMTMNNTIQQSKSTTTANQNDELKRFLDTDKTMGTTVSWFYAMSLEPYRERKERLIMLAEAFAIFGALFLNGIWFVWEYGSSKEFDNDVLKQIFEISCAVEVFATMSLAMFGSFLWMLSTMFGGTQPNFAYNSRHYLAILMILLNLVLISTVVSMLIGIYNRIRSENSEVQAIVLVSMFGLGLFVPLHFGNKLLRESIPLEVYHFPFWFKCLYCPWIFLPRPKELQEHAAIRSVALKKLSHRDNKCPDLKRVEEILQKACQQLGRTNVNLNPILEKLQKDWYDDVDSLKGKSVDVLGNYMPRRLAEVVQEMLETNKDDKDSSQKPPTSAPGTTVQC